MSNILFLLKDSESCNFLQIFKKIVFNQVIKKDKDVSLFFSVPFPVGFGNDQPTSLTTDLQAGVDLWFDSFRYI